MEINTISAPVRKEIYTLEHRPVIIESISSVNVLRIVLIKSVSRCGPILHLDWVEDQGESEYPDTPVDE